MKTVYIHIDEYGNLQKFKSKVHTKAVRAKEWVCANKQGLMFVVPAALGSLSTVIRVVGKRANLHKEQEFKDCYVYDRSLGHYFELRRKLTNKEWSAIDARKANGERLADILNDLKVLE